MIRFSTNMTERRLKRVAIMAEQFIGGLLDEENKNDYIFGFKFVDQYGDLPAGTRVESMHHGYDPACIIVLLSNPAWPEVECGEFPPLLNSNHLALRHAFVNKKIHTAAGNDY